MLHTGDLIQIGLLGFVSGYTELLKKELVDLGSEEIPANDFFFYFNMRNDDIIFFLIGSVALQKSACIFILSVWYTTFKKMNANYLSFLRSDL